MRQFAITYPQLMNQARALHLDEYDLTRLHCAFDIAQRLVDGLYRKQGVPFLCHLIRTASIVMAETRQMDVIVAALLHAVYFLHYFDRSSRRGPRKSDRAFLRAQIGEDAEHLIERYAAFPWNRPGVIPAHSAAYHTYSEEKGQLLLMKLANELEDHLDASVAYVPTSDEERRYHRYGAEYLELARNMGREALASELEETFERCTATPILDVLITDRRQSYELTDRLWLANPLERAGSSLRRYRSRRGSRSHHTGDAEE